MLLMSLPNETLLEIFDCLGSEYFQRDHSRLLVCKNWCALARVVCWKSIILSSTRLDRLIHGVSTKNATAVFANNINLEIKLSGNDDWHTPTSGRSPESPLHVYNHSNEFWDSAEGQSQLEKWTTKLNENVDQLVEDLKQGSKLKRLCIQVFTEVNPHIDNATRRNYISPSNIQSLLSTGLSMNLDSLELDLCGLDLVAMGSDTEPYHVCSEIQPFLSKVRRLRLRSYNICTVALTLIASKGDTPLEEVIVNLSLANESPGMLSGRLSHHCNGQSKFSELLEELKDQMKVLATQMSTPGMVRILSHKQPHLKMQAYDVLTDENSVFPEFSSWDQIGESEKNIDQEGSTESELSSISSFSNS